EIRILSAHPSRRTPRAPAASCTLSLHDALPICLHNEGLVPNRRHDALGLLGRADVRLLAVDAMELGLEGRRVLPGQRRRNGPVLLRAEGLALALAVADQLDGHRLHAAHAEAPADLLPQQLTALVADDAIEHAPGLLGVDQVHVDLPGGQQRALDG